MQIGRFFYRTDKTRFSKASVTLSVTGFTGIASTGFPCFSFAPRGFFAPRIYFLPFQSMSLTAFLLIFLLIFIFLTALPFFLFSMFFMFMGVFHVFLFYACNVFQCLYVLMF